VCHFPSIGAGAGNLRLCGTFELSDASRIAGGLKPVNDLHFISGIASEEFSFVPCFSNSQISGVSLDVIKETIRKRNI
jgi:hypothetical protein